MGARSVLTDGLPISEYFHRIDSLVPEDQNLLSVSYATPVDEALRLMGENGYSQLPVMSGQQVRGLFSYKSFAQRSRKVSPGKQKDLGGFQVERLMFKPEMLVSGETEIPDIFDLIDEYESVLVGTTGNLLGIVTSVDVLEWLDELGRPFIFIGEIERSLRAIVDEMLDGPDFERVAEVALKSYCKKTGRDVPESTDNMNLRELQLLVVRGDNWPVFGEALGGDLDTVKYYLDPLPEIRNKAFHFRDELSGDERRILAVARDWLITILHDMGMKPTSFSRGEVPEHVHEREQASDPVDRSTISDAIELAGNLLGRSPVRSQRIQSDDKLDEGGTPGLRDLYRARLLDGSNMLLADEKFEKLGTRLISAFEFDDQTDASLRSLQSRLRMGVMLDGDGMCRVSLSQVRKGGDGRITLDSVSLQELDEGSGLDLQQTLQGLGATAVGTRKELFGDGSMGPDRINVLFPPSAHLVPIAAYLLTRVVPLLRT